MASKTFTASDGKTFTDRSEYRKYEFQLSYTFTGKEGVHDLMKAPGAVDGQPFDMANLKNCTAVVMDRTDQVQIDELEGCKVFLGATSESLFVRNCKDCVFYVSVKQLRTRDCENCTFYLYCISEPIIEMSTGMKFGCFNGGYPEQAAHMDEAGLDPKVNKWSMVFDFNDEAKTGKNWRVLPMAEYAEPWWPSGSGEGYERAVPLLEGDVAAAQAYSIVPPEDGGGLSFSFSTTQEAAEQAAAQAEPAAPPAPPPSAPPPPAAAAAAPPEAPPAAAVADGEIVVGTKVEAKFAKGTTWYLATVAAVHGDGASFDLNYLDGNKETKVLAAYVQVPQRRTVGWNPSKAKEAAEKRKELGVAAPQCLGSDPKAGLILRALLAAEEAADTAAGLPPGDGHRVEALYNGQGSAWYAGVVSKVHANGSYDIEFDDGDKEVGAKASNVRRPSPAWKVEVTAKEAAAAAVVYTAAAPGEFNAAKHVPVVTITEGKVTVVVPHGMDPEHWIEYVWAKDQSGTVVAGVKLTPTDKPELSFDLPAGATSITGFECCNKHGLWKSDDISMV